jgi:AcrR family transcriptional regulator
MDDVASHSIAISDGRLLKGLDTRSKLIRGATLQFARMGFDRASVRLIAKQSEISFQLVAYYFRTKDELWLAVIEELFEQAHKAFRQLEADARLPSADQLRVLVRRAIEWSVRNPYLRRIVLHEYLDGSERYPKTLLPRLRKLTSAWRTICERHKELSGGGPLSAVEAQLLFNGLLHFNTLFPYEAEFFIGRPLEDAWAVELQIELFFSLLTTGRGPELKPVRAASWARATGPNRASKVSPPQQHKPDGSFSIATPHRLLAAATDMFVRRGYHNASLRDIAKASGVAYQLVRYHFGSKAGLWAATLVYLLDERCEAIRASRFDPAGDLVVQLRTWLRRFMFFAVEEPQLRRILAREYFDNSEHFTRTIRPRIDELFLLLNSSYGEMRESDAIRYMSVSHTAVLLLSVGMTPALQPDSVELITGLRASDPRSIELHIRLLEKLLTGGRGQAIVRVAKRSSRKRQGNPSCNHDTATTAPVTSGNPALSDP